MNRTVLLALLFPLLFAGCGKEKTQNTPTTTDTLSSEFSTLVEKQEFLERYVNFRRSYEDLDFNLMFRAGGGRTIPGATEWNVRILATVPEGEIEQWIDGLAPASAPNLNWVSDIPDAPTDLNGFEWYEGDRVIIGIDRKSGAVLYQNSAS